MAYYYNNSGDNYQTHFGEYYNQNSDTYSNNNNFVPQNNYEPSIYNLFDYHIPTPHYSSPSFSSPHSITTAYSTYTPTEPPTPHYSSPSFSSPHSVTTAYSTYTPTEPKSVQHYYYDPNCYQLTVTTCYDQTPQTTQLVKSHNVVEPELFNVPEFEEYDATPYGGGYDIDQTYGRPLPPSDQTCYPREGGGSPPKKKKVTFATDGVKPEKPAPPPPPPPQPERKEEGGPKGEANEEKREAEKGGHEIGQPERIRQIPSGYGLEAMDLCESLFGFWPCHARFYAERRSGFFACCHGYGGCECGGGGGGGGGDHGNGAADYLFGSCDPYVERRDGGGSFGQPIHCYERRYQEQPLSVRVEFDQYHQLYDHHLDQDDDHSWSQNFRIF